MYPSAVSSGSARQFEPSVDCRSRMESEEAKSETSRWCDSACRRACVSDAVSHRNHCLGASEKRLLILGIDGSEGCEEKQCDERAS